MDKTLDHAYRMIYDFKAGVFTPGSAMTAEHEELVTLLADDLGVAGDRNDPGSLMLPVSRADTFWNQQAMGAIIRYQDLLAAGSRENADASRSAFLARCPSAWYREQVSNGCRAVSSGV